MQRPLPHFVRPKTIFVNLNTNLCSTATIKMGGYVDGEEAIAIRSNDTTNARRKEHTNTDTHTQNINTSGGVTERVCDLEYYYPCRPALPLERTSHNVLCRLPHRTKPKHIACDSLYILDIKLAFCCCLRRLWDSSLPNTHMNSQCWPVSLGCM